MHNMPYCTKKRLHQHLRQQRGIVLVVSLIMLLVLTLIGVTGMRTTILEEKMAGNMRDKNTAFQAAEAALRDGEQLVQGLVATSSFNGSAGRLALSDTDPDFFDSATWSDSNSIAYSESLAGVAAQPRYIVKYMGQAGSGGGGGKGESLDRGRGYGQRQAGSVINFRVTARGTGRSDTSQALLQAYYGKPM